MSNNSSRSGSAGGVSFASLLGLLFIGLKLGGVIHWSWWWVLAPFWVGASVWAVVMLFLLAVIGLAKVVENSQERKARQERAERIAELRRRGLSPVQMTRIVDGRIVRDRSTWRD